VEAKGRGWVGIVDKHGSKKWQSQEQSLKYFLMVGAQEFGILGDASRHRWGGLLMDEIGGRKDKDSRTQRQVFGRQRGEGGRKEDE
jgi:hypothetical protein